MTVRLVTVLPLGDVTVVDFLETDLPLGVVEVLLLTGVSCFKSTN